MPTINPTDPLFTAEQTAILQALGIVRSEIPAIDLPTLCRFDAGRAVYHISDMDAAGRLYGVRVDHGAPFVGYIDRAELEAAKAIGRLYRGDLEPRPTIGHIAAIAHMRAVEAA